MNLRPVVLGLLVTACLTAAAGGAFVAVRQNRAEAAHATPGFAAIAPSSPQPVRETEGVVADSAPVTLPAEVPDSAAPAATRTLRREASRTGTRTANPPTPRIAPPARPATDVVVARNADPATQSNSSPALPTRDAAALPAGSVVEAPVSDAAPIRSADPAPAGPEPRFVEVVVPASSVIGLQVGRGLSSETAQLEDRVEARVTRDVMAGGQRAIPAGARVLGSVVLVERGGKVKGQARLGVRFHTLVLADGSQTSMRTESIFREGDSAGAESSRKIGGAAVGGAILGAILGGGKGAMIGGATGAAGGTAAVMAGKRNSATLPAGAIITAHVSEPVTVQVERD